MTAARTSRKALLFIFVTVFIDVVGLGIVIPVWPKLISELANVGLSEAARYGGWLFFVYAGMQFLCAPVIGNLSDRFGRRPVLIYALVSVGIDYLIMGLAPTIGWLFVGRVLSGMSGASYTTATAYIADVSPPEKRAANFGLVGAAFGLGFIIGPGLGGILSLYDVRLPFFLSAGLALANALFGFFVLKESWPKERRRKFEWWRANPLGSLMALRRFPFVFGLCGVLVFMRFAHDANPATWTYFTMLRFHWNPAEVSYSLMAIGAVTAVAYGGLTRLIIPRIGEVCAVYVGLASGAIGFAGFAFSTAGWQMYAWMSMFALMALAMPALNAIMSKEVDASEQGELQGAIASIGSLTSIFAPLVMSYLFAYFTSTRTPVYFPGASFLAAGACLALAALAFSMVKPHAINAPAGPDDAAERQT